MSDMFESLSDVEERDEASPEAKEEIKVRQITPRIDSITEQDDGASVSWVCKILDSRRMQKHFPPF